MPNICNIFEIILMTGIDNKKLLKDFRPNKLHSEVLKSFLEAEKLWASFCLGKVSNVRTIFNSIYQLYDLFV